MWVDEFKTKTQTINSGKSEDLVQQYKKHMINLLNFEQMR